MARIQADFEGPGRIGTRIDTRRAVPFIVMPGLVPGIHFRLRDGPDGDARNKSGHDGESVQA